MKQSDNAPILYEDNHLLFAEKPAGIRTQPDWAEQLRSWIKQKYHKPGNVFLHPIHRLDSPVCGIVLFAKTTKALGRLQQMMRERTIQRKYRAIVEGKIPLSDGTLIHQILHTSFRAVISPKGKEAILHYRVVGHVAGGTIVHIDLVTGRYHQIRIQFATAGFPIWGDHKYGSHQRWPHGIALQHYEMGLQHPVTLQEITVKVSHTF